MLLRAFWQSLRAVLARRPDVVLGMGGYTAFPGGMMAALMNRPLVIHEQNSIAGLTNRVLACLADRVLVAFPSAFTSLKDRPVPCRKAATEWVGNPVREPIAALAGEHEKYDGRSGPLRLLVVGGSLGAPALNELLPQALALMPPESRPQVVHQSGRQHVEKLRAKYAAAGVEADARDYIEDMATLYEWCDVAVCRAGAMTVAELACAGVPALLVPFPFAVDDHQTTNAKYLADAGAAWCMQQKDLDAGKLAAHLSALSRDALAAMSRKAQALAKPEATRTVAAAALVYASFVVLSSRFGAGVPARVLALHLAQVAALLCVGFALAGGGLALPRDPRAWLSVAGIGVIGTVVAMICFLTGMALVGPTRASVLSSLEVPVTLGLAFALLGERLSPQQWLGAALILAAVAFQNLGVLRRAFIGVSRASE